MSKPRLIEAKFIADLQAEITRLTKQVTRLDTRIRALKQEIEFARLERDRGSPTGRPNPAPLID